MKIYKPNIYLTKNKLNDLIYIGQSKYLDNNYFGSGVLIKKAIKKYGKNNFEKEVLEFCSKEELDKIEKKYIFEMNSIQNGYNILEGGQGGFSPKGEKNPMSKKVFVYDFYGNKIEEFIGVKDKARKLNINQSAIVRVLTSKRFHYKKMIYSYEELSKDEIVKRVKNWKEKLNRKTKKTFIGSFPEKKEEVFYNTEEFARTHFLNGRSIRLVLEGKRKTHKGWSFKYV